MAKYLVETYYTCTFKVNHYLDDINETEFECEECHKSFVESFREEHDEQ